MISAQAIYKRMIDLINEFSEGSQIVKTAKQFIRENVDDKYINKETGIIKQKTEIAEIPKLDKRADMIDDYIPTVAKAYDRASKQLAEIKEEAEVNKARQNGASEDEVKEIRKSFKSGKNKPKTGRQIKNMSEQEKAPYKAKVNQHSDEVSKVDKLKWDLYNGPCKDSSFPRQSRAKELCDEAFNGTIGDLTAWIEEAESIMADFDGYKAGQATAARGKIISDGHVEINPNYDPYDDF